MRPSTWSRQLKERDMATTPSSFGWTATLTKFTSWKWTQTLHQPAIWGYSSNTAHRANFLSCFSFILFLLSAQLFFFQQQTPPFLFIISYVLWRKRSHRSRVFYTIVKSYSEPCCLTSKVSAFSPRLSSRPYLVASCLKNQGLTSADSPIPNQRYLGGECCRYSDISCRSTFIPYDRRFREWRKTSWACMLPIC